MCGQKTEKEATELAAIIKKQTFTLDMLRPFAGSIAPVYTGDTGNVFAMDLQEDGDPIVLSGTERVELIVHSQTGVHVQDSKGERGGGITLTAGSGRVEIRLHPGVYSRGSNQGCLCIYSSGEETEDTSITTMPFIFEALEGAEEKAVAAWAGYPTLVRLLQGAVCWQFGTEVTGTGSGIQAPVADSEKGCCYLNTETGALYKALAPDTWVYMGCLQGPAGESAYLAAVKGGYAGESGEFYKDLGALNDLAAELEGLR